MSTTYGPAAPTSAKSAQATWHTAQVNADPRSTMAERITAASAEAAAMAAIRHQPETEGTRADLELEAGS